MTAKDIANIEKRLVDAIAQKDTATMIECYRRAAAIYEATGDENSAAFFFTNAYVFALEAGSPHANELRGKLIALGRI